MDEVRYCACGCGERVERRRKGKGQPFAKWKIGHHRRKSSVRWVVDPDTGCHVWQGAVTKLGYGLTTRDGRRLYAHRDAYEIVHGPIPKGIVLDHLCRNPSCINPEHLEPVTQAENMRRGKNTILTAVDVDAIRSSLDPYTVTAKRYGVHPTTVLNIRARRCWTA